MSTCRPACLGICVLISAATLAGQQPTPPQAPQPGALVQFGAVQVSACASAKDPEYGLVKDKPILIGGGPMYMAARQRNYLNALRGPDGQPVRVGNSVGSSAPNPTDPERAIIDSYGVTYDGPTGPVAKTIYMDAYHFDAPKLPAGFACGAPLPSAVGMPPADPFKMGNVMVSLAIDQGSKGAITPIKLDVSAPRGYLFDRYAMIAMQARAAAEAGKPMDAEKPPKDVEPQGWVVLAFPVMCGDRSIPPKNVELNGPQGPIGLTTAGEVLRDDALAKAFPGVPAAPGSVGLRFRNVQPVQAKITYAEGCNGASADVTLPIRNEPPRLLELVPAPLPAGAAAEDSTVYVQAFIDPEGKVGRPQYLGGPRALYPAALEALGKWRLQPQRLNGTPVVNPQVLQVPFR